MAEELTITPDIDRIEAAMSVHPRQECPSFDHFAPGIYVRETHVPAGTLLVSEIHKFEHPFVLAKGRIHVRSETEGSVIYEGPQVGITKAGTRRVVYVETDCVMITCHPTDKKTAEEVAEEILVQRENPFVEDQESIHQWKEALCLGSR